MTIHKYNPSVVARVGESDVGGEKGDDVFPIASMSKSFCGTVCALMAADGKFGKNGIDATLKEILQQAKIQHGNRGEQIDEYLQILEDKGLSDTTISQLLTHSSGLKDDHEMKDGEYADKPISKYLSDKLNKWFAVGETRYSNDGFILLEEIVNLASDHETTLENSGYKQELQNRVFGKIGTTNTKSIYESAEAVARTGSYHQIQGTLFKGKKVAVSTDSIPATRSPTGRISLAAGGLCSTVNDLSRYGLELVKMVAGQASAFESDPAKCAAIKQMYHAPVEKEHAKKLASGEELPKFVRVDSLGLAILESEGRVALAKDGALQTNQSMMSFEIARSYEDFISETKPIKPEEISNGTLFMQQTDFVANHYLCSEFEQKKYQILNNFFDARLDASDKEKIDRNSFGFERDKRLQQKQDLLIAQEKLPKNFADIRAQIEENFVPQFLNEYLNKAGVIDSAKVAKDFHNAEIIAAKIGPELARAVAESDALLEKLNSQDKQGVTQSFVEKLGLKSRDEGKSFVERTGGSKDERTGRSKDERTNRR